MSPGFGHALAALTMLMTPSSEVCDEDLRYVAELGDKDDGEADRGGFGKT